MSGTDIMINLIEMFEKKGRTIKTKDFKRIRKNTKLLFRTTGTDIYFGWGWEYRKGKKYYYKIRPSLVNSLVSDSTTAETLKFPEEKTVVTGEKHNPMIRKITVQGSYLFIASGSAGIKIIDSSDSNDPVEIGSLVTSNAEDIVIRGERAYVADGDRGLKVVDISDPANPTKTNYYNTNNDAYNITLSNDGTKAYVANWNDGLMIVDISDPTNLTKLGSFDTKKKAMN